MSGILSVIFMYLVMLLLFHLLQVIAQNLSKWKNCKKNELAKKFFIYITNLSCLLPFVALFIVRKMGYLRFSSHGSPSPVEISIINATNFILEIITHPLFFVGLSVIIIFLTYMDLKLKDKRGNLEEAVFKK